MITDNKHWLLSEKSLLSLLNLKCSREFYTFPFLGKFRKFKPPSLYKGTNGFNYALSLWETMLACKVIYIHNEYNVRIIVLNSLRNKYAECDTRTLARRRQRVFIKIEKYFLHFARQYWISTIFLKKSIQWMSKIFI